MIKVGIYGASGYMGGEVIRVLLEHPEAEIAWLTSRGDKPVEYYHKNLYGMGLKFIKPEEVRPCDVVFAALPTGQIMKQSKKLMEAGTKVIDLGADFRLKNRNDGKNLWENSCRLGNSTEAVYGIPEFS